MQKITELFIIIEDKSGIFGEITRLLKKKRISIYAVGVFLDTARLYVSHPELALEIMEEKGYQAELREVLQVLLPNKPGALMDLSTKLGNAGINIKYLYGTMEEQQKRGLVVLEVDKPDLALDIFQNHRF